ncbi:unnamed protein product [Alternaria alternata]|jgi:hypothetical protein
MHNHESDQQKFRTLERNVDAFMVGGFLKVLHFAASTNNLFRIKHCVAYGSFETTGDWRSMTIGKGYRPLHCAALFGHSSAIELLLNSGAEVDVTGYDLKTALHLAVKSGNHESVRMLLTRGASVNAMNQDQFTPLSLCLAMTQYSTHWTFGKQQTMAKILCDRYATVDTSHWAQIRNLPATLNGQNTSMRFNESVGKQDYMRANLVQVLRRRNPDSELIQVIATQRYNPGDYPDWHRFNEGDVFYIRRNNELVLRNRETDVQVLATDQNGIEKNLWNTHIDFDLRANPGELIQARATQDYTPAEEFPNWHHVQIDDRFDVERDGEPAVRDQREAVGVWARNQRGLRGLVYNTCLTIVDQ